MTAPLRLILSIIFGTIIVGVAALQGHVVILAVPLMVYLFAAVLQQPEAVNLDIRREVIPEFAPQGTPITVKLTITNYGQAIDEVVVHDVLPDGMTRTGGESSWAASLQQQGKIELEYTVVAQRGAYDNYEALVLVGDCLGLFEQVLIHRSRGRLLVHPHYLKLDRIKIRPPQTRGFAGPIAARQGGTGIDFWGIREYQSGDPQRQINWKLAARADHELYTNIFEQERVADVGIILDARQRVNVVTESGALFEHSVHAAAALAENFLDDGNRVSLLIYGSSLKRIYPGYGRHQRDRILKALSGTHPRVNYALENLDYLPTRLFPAQSQIVLVSPLVPEDIPVIIRIRAHGYAVMVISPDPISYESALYQDFTSPPYRVARAERDFMLRQIRRSGALVINWRVNQPLAAAVRQTLTHQSSTFHFNEFNETAL